MYKLTPIFLLLLAFNSSIAQSKSDVVYLKNGGVFRGTVLPNSEPQKIELRDGSIIVFRNEEVDSIRKEDFNRAYFKRLHRLYYSRQKGFENISELSFLGIDNPKKNYLYNTSPNFDIGIHTINGYRFSPYLFLGAGVGVDRYISYRQTFSPLYVRIQTEVLKRKITPTFFIDLGYAHLWRERYLEQANEVSTRSRGGAYVAAGAGMKVYTSSKVAFSMSISYQLETGKRIEDYYPNTTYEEILTTAVLYQRGAISAGIQF